MMQVVLPRSWRDDLERAAAALKADALDKDRSARFEVNQRDRREKLREAEQEKQERREFAAVESILATTEQITAFKVELDTYDAKTVEALMDNQEALAAVRETISGMLYEAEVLPDGRRVFKTMDGQRVFDEHGEEISKDVIDPASIHDKKPRWETFERETLAEQHLQEDREKLIEYQTKLDDARERLDGDDITAKELKALEDDLAADMPDAVRAKLDRDDPAAQAPTKQVQATPSPESTDALLRQTGFTLTR